ncbi:MAG: hypothetical protein ABIO21_05980 [Pseudomonas sp.]
MRVFKCITRAAELLRRYGVAKFTVVLQGQPPEEDDEDLIGSSQSLSADSALLIVLMESEPPRISAVTYSAG